MLKAESKPVSVLSLRDARHVPVERLLRNHDWYLCRILLSVKYSIVSSCIFFIMFETTGEREIGRKCLGSVLETFLYRDLSFANLQLFGT